MCAAADQLTMQPIKTIAGHVKLPGSKSLSNRILLLAALAQGTTTVLNLLVRFLDSLHMVFRQGGIYPNLAPLLQSKDVVIALSQSQI